MTFLKSSQLHAKRVPAHSAAQFTDQRLAALSVGVSAPQKRRRIKSTFSSFNTTRTCSGRASDQIQHQRFVPLSFHVMPAPVVRSYQ